MGTTTQWALSIDALRAGLVPAAPRLPTGTDLASIGLDFGREADLTAAGRARSEAMTVAPRRAVSL